MRYYFEERAIVSTLNENIKHTKGDDITSLVTPLLSQVSLQNLYTEGGQEQKMLVKDCTASCKLGLIVIRRRKG